MPTQGSWRPLGDRVTASPARAAEAEALSAARDPAVLLRGPGATITGLSPCTNEPQVLIEGVP